LTCISREAHGELWGVVCAIAKKKKGRGEGLYSGVWKTGYGGREPWNGVDVFFVPTNQRWTLAYLANVSTPCPRLKG
jgi:hypothetical protein